jgi:tetratricopeptide (TPR) repeat protein
VSLPSLAEVEHADWTALERLCADLGLNPKGRSSVVRMRVLDHVRKRVRPESWRPGAPQQAAFLTRLGHPDAAARLWESAIQLDEPAPWIGLGRAHLGSGDLREAAKAFDRAIQMGDAAANLHRAESLAAAGDYEGAVRACDAYLVARPRELRGLLLKANFLARGGWTSEAATVMRDAFESHPDAREMWRGLGTLLLRADRYEAATEAYHEALRADPKDYESWINRGAALLLEGRTREAVGAFREVLEADPRQAVALNNLGIAYLREGQMKSAAINLERAAKHMETPQVLRNVAKVQEATHQVAAAAESYARLLALKPRDADALAARKRLEPRPRRRRKAPPRRPRSRKKAPAPRPRTKKARRPRIVPRKVPKKRRAAKRRSSARRRPKPSPKRTTRRHR